ncbi:MAG: divalent-cation tolerance protein CutA [Planctomycetota bacterium]|nr:divalent-cation tolerance protein CutA [Planctomycetota bacterium]
MSDDRNVSSPSTLAPGDDVRVVLSTAPPGEAARLAHRLVEEGLAACVNLVPGVRSVYRWKGSVADDPETLMLLKVPAAGLEALADRLVELHSYEVPELLALTPERGLAAYLAWAAAAGGEA